MASVRNALISLGLLWLSGFLALGFGWSLEILNRRLTYGESALGAVAMGIMMTLDRSLAAAAAGAATTFFASGQNPQRWAFVIAAAEILVVRMRSYWELPPTVWDRISLVAARAFPAIACLAAAYLTARLLRDKHADQQSKPQA